MDIEKEHEAWNLLNTLTLGENGELAFTTTGDKNLDLFGTVNRDTTIENLVTKFIDAWNENPKLAIKVLLNFRDIREGKGEKLISRVMLFVVKCLFPEVYQKLLPLFIEVGCWKDALFMYEMGIHYDLSDTTEIKEFSKTLLADKNLEHPSLCAKWAPSERCHFDKKTKNVKKVPVSKEIMKELKVGAKEYRKILTELRSKIKLVETQLSQGKLSEINFSTVPSRAHLLYKNAFSRDSNANKVVKPERAELKERYQKYLADLSSGKETVNFKGIMPHELLKQLYKDRPENFALIESQWNAIRSEIEKISVFEKCLSIVDVSGSMSSAGLRNSGPTPIEVAIALGILVSECAKEPFRNKMFTFSETPILADINVGDLYQKVKYVANLPWGGSTNMEAVFDKIIQIGLTNNLSQEQMPERLFIFTDMQFNEVSGNKLKTFDKIKEKFTKYGYVMPQIICWNLRSVDNVVFTKDDKDICMLSGFSTPIMKAFLTCEQISPMMVFLSAVINYKVPDIELGQINKSLINVPKLIEVVKKIDFKNGGNKDKINK